MEYGIDFNRELNPPGETSGDSFEHPSFFNFNQAGEVLNLSDHDATEEFRKVWDLVVRVRNFAGNHGTGYVYRFGGSFAVLTNNHVVVNDDITVQLNDNIIRQTKVQFFHDDSSRESVICNGLELLSTYPFRQFVRTLDFVLFLIESPPSSVLHYFIPTITENSQRADIADCPIEYASTMIDPDFGLSSTRITMIGHPRGGKKKFSCGHLLHYSIQPHPGTPLRKYKLASRPGNSGSPVFVSAGFQTDSLLFGKFPFLLHVGNELGIRHYKGIDDWIHATLPFIVTPSNDNLASMHWTLGILFSFCICFGAMIFTLIIFFLFLNK